MADTKIIHLRDGVTIDSIGREVVLYGVIFRLSA